MLMANGNIYEFQNEELKKQKEYSKKLIQKAIKSICVHVPELGSAFEKFGFKETEIDVGISTDGNHIIYNPHNVFMIRQKMGLAEIQKQLLHIVFHYLRGDILRYRCAAHKELFGAIIDAEVSDIINDVRNGGMIATSRRSGDYYRKKSDRKAAKAFIEESKSLYYSDEHSFWLDSNYDAARMLSDMENALEEMFGESIKDAILAGQISFADELHSKFGKKIYAMFFGGNGGIAAESEHTPTKSNTDYMSVVEHLIEDVCVERESVQVIDTNLYCYGLEMYEDMPIVEPGEDETIQKGINGRLALAIDTSGSCQGQIADRFLGEIGGFLKQLLSYGSHNDFELVVFECDSEIQKEEHYKNKEISKAFSGTRKLIGMGGTSFVPVFQRMEEMSRKDQKPFAGLIYFSDGIGEFPEDDKKPQFPVIFVLTKNLYGTDEPDIPDYVIKTYMHEYKGGN